MASILGLDIGNGLSLPSMPQGIGTTILILLIALLIAIVIIVCIWFWYQNKIFNKKVIVFENIGNRGYQKTGYDTARLIKVGDGGEEILFLRSRKIYRTAYGKKMGDNEYWFAVGQDGYWYNVILGDLDAKMGMLDIEPVDRDMRYMHVAIRKNITERYKKQNWMEKYGTILMNSIFLIVMLVGLWFLIDKLVNAATLFSQSLDATNRVLESLQNILGKMDTMCAGGSGFIK